MSDERPQGWATAKLNDVVSFALGGDWGKDADDLTDGLARVRVVRGTEFRNWRDEKGASAAERRIKVSSLAKRRLQKGDLVLEVSGGGPNQPVGRTVLIDDEALKRADAPLVCSNFFRLLRIQAGVDPNFIGHFLSYAYARGAFNEFQTETTNLRNLNVPDFLEKTEVALAPLAEQRRIVAKLETLLGKVDASQQRLAKIPVLLKRFRQSVLAAACSGRLTADWREENPQSDTEPADGTPSTDLPDSWRFSSVEELAKIGSGQSSKLIISKCDTSGEIPWFKVSDMNLEGNERLMRRSQNYLSRRNVDELGMKVFPTGTIIFPKRGGAISTNKKRVLTQPSCIDSNTMALTPNACLADYFWTWFSTMDLGRLADGSSVPQINNPDILPLEVPLPPLPEQQEIVRRVEGLFALADQLEARFTKARAYVDKLTPALLARAFSGQLVPQDPTDEPAEKLLARIKRSPA